MVSKVSVLTLTIWNRIFQYFMYRLSKYNCKDIFVETECLRKKNILKVRVLPLNNVLLLIIQVNIKLKQVIFIS